jgi:hypothetical protein
VRGIASNWTGSLKTGLFLGDDDLPTAWYGRAGGPGGWAGLRRDAAIAPELLWGRVGLEYLYRSELRFEVAGSVGWAAQQLADAERVLGVSVAVVLDTVLGPVRVGVQSAQKVPTQAVVQVGYEF